MDIYSALAERIGIHSFKNELQDLAFVELYPRDKLSIERQLNFIRKDGKSLVQEIINELKGILADPDIGLVDITGREKKLCSIWRKIQNKKLSFENLSDVFAFRIIVENDKNCYAALCAIHSNYHMVHGGFKDYISTPKINGYKSLHTIIIGPKNYRIEIQIRTNEMWSGIYRMRNNCRRLWCNADRLYRVKLEIVSGLNISANRMHWQSNDFFCRTLGRSDQI